MAQWLVSRLSVPEVTGPIPKSIRTKTSFKRTFGPTHSTKGTVGLPKIKNILKLIQLLIKGKIKPILKRSITKLSSDVHLLCMHGYFVLNLEWIKTDK